MELSKQQLLAIQAGDNQHFGTLIACYQDRVYGLAFKMARNPHDAEEITQRVFIKCHQKIKQYAFKAKFSVWLYSITFHESASYLKDKKRWRFIELKESTQKETAPAEAETALHQNDLSRTVHELLNQLNPNQRMLLTLFYLEEMSYQEICSITGFSLARIKVMLHRAKRKLKKIYLSSENQSLWKTSIS